MVELRPAPARKSRIRIGHLRMAAILVLSVFPGAFACHRNPGPPAPKVILNVSNTGFFDVNVFVIRSSGGSAIRLGMVGGGAHSTFSVPETHLQPGHMMVVQVRTIGAGSSWTSPSLVIGNSTIARLDVVTNSSGNLNQSQFYTQR